MKKIFSFLILFVLSLGCAIAEGEPESPEAVINIPEAVRAGTGIFVDGTKSVNNNPEYPLNFAWRMGDGSFSNAKSFQYIYTRAGEYNIELVVSQVVNEIATNGFINQYYLDSNVAQKIYVYNDMTTLIYDKSTGQKMLADMTTQAKENNFFIQKIGSNESSNSLTQEKILLDLQRNKNSLKDSEMIFISADPIVALNSLNEFHRIYGHEMDFSGKTIVIATNSNLSMISRIARGTLLSLKPSSILLVERPALTEIVASSGDSEVYKNILETNQYNFLELNLEENDLLISNFMSYAIGDMVAKGISQQYILYLLIIPVIATVISFMTQVIGMSTSGVLAPILLVFIFLSVGPVIGLAMLSVVILITLLVQKIFQGKRLLSTPKKAFNISFVALAFFGILFVVANINIDIVLSVSILPVVMAMVLADKIVIMAGSKTVKQILKFFLSLYIVSLLAWVLVQYRAFQIIILAYPELTFLFVLLTYLLGRWTGLRLTEYFRFRELIRELQIKEE